MTTSPALLGKHCVVTGGSRGIGAAIAELFAARGARCTLVGRDAGALEAAVRRLPVVLAPLAAAGGQRESQQEDQQQQQQHPYPDHPHHHRVHAMDVSDPDVWAQLVAKTKPEKTHILVNAAGTSQNSLLHRTSAADARRVLDTNLLGTVLGCQAFVPQMMRQREGCIINVSSLLAAHGGRGASVYAASKAGVVGLTRSLAWEVGRFGIRANVLLPGYIETDMTKAMQRDELSARIPMGRLGLVEEVADAALFLATNSYAHNCVLNIDGGLSGT